MGYKDMQENVFNRALIVRINEFLSQKEQADITIKKLLLEHSFFKDKISACEESAVFDHRIIALINKGKVESKFKRLLSKQKEANDGLKELAPTHFKESATSFKELTILTNVMKMHVTINQAVSSQKKTGLQLASRAERMAKRLKLELVKLIEDDASYEDVQAVQKKITELNQERDRFLSMDDKLFRLRTSKHKDIVALITFKGADKAEKFRVNGGGLVVVKSSQAPYVTESFKMIDRYYKDRGSIYDNIPPVENILGFEGLLYDEDVAEQHRRRSKRLIKDDDEIKIRPQGDSETN